MGVVGRTAQLLVLGPPKYTSRPERFELLMRNIWEEGGGGGESVCVSILILLCSPGLVRAPAAVEAFTAAEHVS